MTDRAYVSYDAQGRPAFLDVNGDSYAYVHSLQGDVIGLLDGNGRLVIEYRYDAWGKPTQVCTLTSAYDEVAEFNPFRYRGYVYDEETGLYYLRSRYYDPQVCRFVNADDRIDPTALESMNSFSYCSNNITTRKDSFGHEKKGANCSGNKRERSEAL